jgi:hypothetical protein
VANLRTPVYSGITEFGDIESGPTDVPWGATEQNGVTVAITGEDVDVQSGQALMLEDSFPSTRTIEVTARLQHGGLLNLKDALGMPDSALTGDLQATPTATDEVLAIVGTNIGTEELNLYADQPGPVSTRRYDFKRCKQRAGMTLELGSNNYTMLESVWQVLNPTSGNAVEITDAST